MATYAPGTASLRPPSAGGGTAPPAMRVAALDPAREAVIRLSRAVQRAAIYPAEHPSVRLALGPFLDVLNGLVRDGGRLQVVVLRDRLMVSASDETPREHRAGWLASQLYSRRVTSLTFDALLDADECLAFVHWLGESAKDSPERPPVAPGIHLTRLDYSRARFDETPRPPIDETLEAIAAWNALAVRLAPSTAGDASGAPVDPARIAGAIEADLAAAEGTGVTSVTGRLIQAGGGIAALPEAERQAVRSRLAAVVSALPDEIRRQILAALPHDSPGKIDLLNEILDALPRERLLELVPRVDMTPGAHARQFLTFLVKLVSLAHTDPAVGEAVETQVVRHGLPIDLLQSDADSAQRMLDELFTHAVQPSAVIGDVYQASLQDLCAEQRGTLDALDLSRYDDPQDRAAISAHVGHIALHLLRGAPGEAADPQCLQQVRDAARRDLEDERVDLVSELAAIVVPLAAGPMEPETRALVEECLALCREPRTAERLMRALDSHIGLATEPLAALFAVSGLPAATMAMARVADLPDGPLRDRLGNLLARLELGVVRQAIMQAYAEGASVSRLLSVFRCLDPARTPDLARVFIRNQDPAVRREALEVLSNAPLAPVKRERVMLRALSDEDPGVVRVALRELSLHQTAPGLAGLTSFLARTDGAGLEPLQAFAVATLRQSWTPHAIDALAPALLARRRAFDPGARRVSRAMVAALDAADDERARAAARTWRRSAAGMWSACVGERPEAWS
jgi:hypothetical protein